MTGCIPWILGAIVPILTAPPDGLTLNAPEKWYRDAKGAETLFEGVVQRTPSTGRIGPPTRFNAFRLTWTDGAGRSVSRELYAPVKAHLFADYLDQRIRLMGKAVDTDVDGATYQEIWPARLLTDKAVAVLQARDGILARTSWQPEGVQRGRLQTLVIRDGADLARLMRISGDEAERAATEALARRLSVPAIDWNKHMVVVVSAGLKAADADRLTITIVAVKEKELVVSYKMEAPSSGAAGFGFPAETVLVERFAGPARFEEQKPLKNDNGKSP
jgi:hypothetical protein